MDYKEMIEKCLGNLNGNGARLRMNWRNTAEPFSLVSVNAGVDGMGLPWKEIKHLYKGDLNHLEYADYKNMEDIDDGEKHRWVSTVPIDGNDAKYGRAMFCLKTGVLRGLTFDEFYGGGLVD